MAASHLLKPRPSAVDPTPGKLLAAGTQIFARDGYAQARVREIARCAGSNAAAINYHFGGKQGLYLAVLRHNAEQRLTRYPLPEAGAQASGEAALADAIAALVRRVLAEDDAGLLPQLMMREVAAPTEALPLLVRELIAPQFARLRVLVHGILGQQVDEAVVQRCVLSIVGQCLFYRFARPLIEVLAPARAGADQIDALAAHIAQFSIAALHAIRDGDTR